MPKAKFILKPKKKFENNSCCLISYQDFSENDYISKKVVQLKCGHQYYYDNIIESYKITNTSGRNYIGKRICPYCRKSGGYLPYNGSKAIRGIHNLNAVKQWRLKLIESKKSTSGYNTCCANLVSGIHRGYPCGALVKNYESPYIYECIISKLDNHEIKYEFKLLSWCGRHKKIKNKFENNSYNIENYIENSNYKGYLKLSDVVYNEKVNKIYILSENYKNFLNDNGIYNNNLKILIKDEFINNYKK